MANDMTQGAAAEIRKLRLNKPINIKAYKENSDVANSSGSGIM